MKIIIPFIINATHGSSGSSILNLDNNALIRIHIGAEKKEDGCNLGILLSVDIKKFNEK